MPEEKIRKQLIEKFNLPSDKVAAARPRRIFVDVSMADFPAVFDYAVNQMNFVILVTITGLDEGQTMGFIYHLSTENGIVLNIHTSAPKENPVIKTIIAKFPAAEAYERELMDLLGVQVEGLPPGSRYPLPDDWPANQYPLRKDWKPEMLGKKEVK